jgi:CHAT domain-containing protein/Tfp pilus assembly protein PilF
MNRHEHQRKGCNLEPTAVLWALRNALAAAVLSLLVTALSSRAAGAADQPERLTAEQRKELEQRANDLSNAGFQLYQRWAIAPALEKTNQALQIRERLYPKSEYPDGQPKLAESLTAMGKLLQAQGAYGEARAYYERALAMNQSFYRKERYSRGHPELANSVLNLGVVLQAQGDYGEARVYYERALAMRQVLYSKDRYPHGHSDLAASLNAMGVLFEAQGAYGEARAYLDRALAMVQAVYPKERYPQGHPYLATALNNLGSLLQDQGAYGEARGYYERALEMRLALYPKEKYPQGHPDLAKTLNDLGALLYHQGAYGAARGYYERALAITQTLYPKQQYPHGHPSLASSLNNLGVVLQHAGAYGEARGYFERVLAMVQALYPKELYPQGHADLARSLDAMGALLHQHGTYGEALGYFQRAHAMRQALYLKERFPRGHPELATSLNNIGDTLRAQGAYGEARGYLERALAMKQVLYSKERYPQGHADLANGLANMGSLLADHGLHGEAETLFQQAVDMQCDLAETLVAATSEAEALNYLAQLPPVRDGLISVCLHVLESDETSYAGVWRGKAAVARMLQRRQAELFHKAAALLATRRDIETWRGVRGQLARLLLATADGRDHPERLARLHELAADKERLERQLAGAIPEFTRRQALERTPHTKLVEALPEQTVVLDLANYTRLEQNPQIKRENGRRLTPSSIGFVLAKGRPVRAVDLGPTGRIDQAVETWREAIKARQASPAAAILRHLVWDRLAREFPPATTTVVLALDGRLTAVPWAALPGDQPGTVLLEQYALATVPHAPFLLDRLTAPARPTDDRGILVAVGGVAYDQGPKPGEDEKTKLELLAARQAETSRGRGDGWKQLPGTLDELNAVTQLAGSRTVIRLEGACAGTAQLLKDLPRARWAHVATHGFFADPSIPSLLRPDPKLFSSIGRENVGAGLRNPLVLSGLVLAGANRPSAVVDDSTRDDLGILTAEAIAGLPLQDLELVVLSACETGLGMVGGGEGVFGLQRAFHLAGAHNVVASLWKVDDQATAALMAIFYDQLWRQHKPPIEALRLAQLTLYRHPESIPELAKARGTPDFGKLVDRLEPGPDSGQPAPAKHARIDQWAAFVLSGWGE